MIFFAVLICVLVSILDSTQFSTLCMDEVRLYFIVC